MTLQQAELANRKAALYDKIKFYWWFWKLPQYYVYCGCIHSAYSSSCVHGLMYQSISGPLITPEGIKQEKNYNTEKQKVWFAVGIFDCNSNKLITSHSKWMTKQILIDKLINIVWHAKRAGLSHKIKVFWIRATPSLVLFPWMVLSSSFLFHTCSKSFIWHPYASLLSFM